jgi:hypothetical protein
MLHSSAAFLTFSSASPTALPPRYSWAARRVMVYRQNSTQMSGSNVISAFWG